MASSPKNGVGLIITQGIEPQPFNVVDLLDVGIRSVVLIVVVQTKQRKNLIDSLNSVFATSVVNLPSWCR
jgi:hypothetical protein